MTGNRPVPPELLAPAGEFLSAVAAIAYGADAVYLGLSRFSARAEAANFSSDQLRSIVAWAHSRPRPRKIYAALNTLVRDDELDDAATALELAADAGVDAVIVQDTGVHRLASRCFPGLRLHASTQMAVHNLDGAMALADLGFKRVVLARELGIPEIALIARRAGIEVEVFVHGALCYSYSGLCLFSSMENGRSGNRGRCAYCCREAFSAGTAGRGRKMMPFSMRDLALAPVLEEIAEAGVAGLKIEGRMKNPLYVASVTDYYRRKLDGRLDAGEEAGLIENIKTVFSRPWTTLYAATADAPGISIVDPDAVGHRGAPVGTAESIVTDASGSWLRFRCRRAIEKHDGLQIDPPRGGRPLGFAVTSLRPAGSRRTEVSLPADRLVEVLLPPDCAQSIPNGAVVYCSASQAVRRAYSISRPRAEDSRQTHPVAVEVNLGTEGAEFKALSAPAREGLPEIRADHFVKMPLAPAADAAKTDEAVRRAVTRSGDTPWRVSDLVVRNPDGLYVPPSVLNEARRALLAAMTSAREEQRRTVLGDAHIFCRRSAARQQRAPRRASWTAKLALAGPAYAPLSDADEVVLQIGFLPPEQRDIRLAEWSRVLDRARLRLALPLLVREHVVRRLKHDVARLAARGWTRWETPGPAGLRLLRETAPNVSDITADWSFYGLNHLARDEMAETGIARAVASPEDGRDNIVSLAALRGPEVEALVYQHTPLFVSATAPCAGLKTESETGTVVGSRARRFIIRQIDGQWVTTGESPFCVADNVNSLAAGGVSWFRVDLSWTPFERIRFPECWQNLRAERVPAQRTTGNFKLGLA